MNMTEMIDKARLFGSLFCAKSLKRSKPIVVHINITNKCNLRCPYCYGVYWGRKNVKDFTTSQVQSLFDELAVLGTRRINFGGGEPLTRDDIGDLIEYARNKGMVCNMNSNGHLVSENLEIVKKLNSLCISIDGDENNHDKGKGKGSFEKVIEAIKIAKKNKINVHTSTAITKENVNSIDKIFEITKDMKVVTEWLLPFFQTKDSLRADNDDYRNAIKKIIDYKKRGYPVLISYKSLNHTLLWPDYSKKAIIDEFQANSSNIRCYAGRFMCIIDASGYVYPCSQMIDTSFPAENFIEKGFKKAWENLEEHNHCKSCYAFMSFNDYNLLINRDLNTILNYIKNLFVEKRLRDEYVK